MLYQCVLNKTSTSARKRKTMRLGCLKSFSVVLTNCLVFDLSPIAIYLNSTCNVVCNQYFTATPTEVYAT